jgi:hypothetical protein
LNKVQEFVDVLELGHVILVSQDYGGGCAIGREFQGTAKHGHVRMRQQLISSLLQSLVQRHMIGWNGSSKDSSRVSLAILGLVEHRHVLDDCMPKGWPH